MKRRWLWWTLGSVFGLVLLVLLGVVWLVNTQAGTRALFALARNVTNDALEVGRIEGSIVGPLSLRDLTYADPLTGMRVSAASIDLDLALGELLGMTVHVVDAQLSGIDVQLGAPRDEPAEPPAEEPFTLDAPIDVIVDRLLVRNALVRDATTEIVRIDTAAFAGSWLGSSIDVRQLDVDASQGEIRFAGRVSETDAYEGGGKGRFRWQSGERTFAGFIEADARNAAAKIALTLTSPVRANLDVSLQQAEQLPWRFALELPSFDPREELLPESSLESLAASLQGSGTSSQGVARGEIVVNGEALQFEQLSFARTSEALNIGARLLLGGGTLDAKGIVQLAADPVAAKLDAAWSSITIPEQWAGQQLRTEGQLAFAGSAQSYEASGAVRLGPPDRIANMQLRVEGSPETVNVRQFDIVQQDGRLAATGTLHLQPNIAWSLDAKATSFDPGDFATEWPGDLNFTLQTKGDVNDAGPEAHVQLTDLRGRLRGRALSGHADVTLERNKMFSGEADLRSGASRVQLQANPGDVIDAVASIDIPALDDWVPDTAGSVRGRFTVTGKWPAIRIDGQTRGRELRFGDMRAQTLDLTVDVTNPTEPDGSLRLQVADAAAAGMEFSSLDLNGSGSRAAHRLQLEARGSPLGARLDLKGGMEETNWTGTMDQLVIDVEDAAELTLQSPVQLAYSPDESRMSQACFADRAIRLCFEGALQADGSLQANYSLQDVPLALANAFASAESPLAFDGALQGEGRVSRDASGQLAGTANIRLPHGTIARQLGEGEQPEVLLSFDDFALTAALEGDRASGRVDARLNETGALRGELAATALSQPDPQVDGALSMNLPSIAVIEAFAPQLANVQGTVALRANVRGTLEQPNIDGELRLANLATDLPEFGLQLRNGEVTVTPRAQREFDLAGGIQSGDGRLSFDGIVRLDGPSTISIEGKQFVAADMPGARVIIAPDLDIEHRTDRVSIRGDVRIPEAAINVQELPRGGGGGGNRASSDVVIVDAETQEEAEAEAAPIYADVNVILGEKVELAGFGLLAQVGGQLAIIERPGEPTRGSGVVRVAGTYKAYGQDLTIQKGELLYANTPLDNPNLNIVAVREVGEITAGLRVAGNAKNPVLTVFSDPPMGQANALSYLVAGKPLDQIRQSDGEGDALQTAARSLGTAAGGLLAKNLGKRLGVDELGIKDNEMIGGSAFTIGQYLSPRLYLSYGIGLFEPGEVVTLRYKLSEGLALQAQSGTNESRAGVEYRLER